MIKDNVSDTGSNYKFFEGAPKANPPRSMFDVSYINTYTCKQGQVIPCYDALTYMNEDYNYDIEAICRVVNPPVVPLMSRQRMFFHSYWMSFHQIWKNSQIFFDKGKTTGQCATADELVIPTITLSHWERGSLADYLGFNIVDTTGVESFTFPALKFVAYVKIMRDYYINQRLHASSLEASDDSDDALIYAWMYPLDDADFRIGSPQWNALVQSQTAVDKLFGSVWYRDFADDYFTRCQLKPIYTDDIPTVPINIENLNFGVRDDVPQTSPTANYMHGLGIHSENIMDLAKSSYVMPFGANVPSGNNIKQYSTLVALALNRTFNLSGNTLSGITIDAIRNCEASTLILEKMAKTDGSYGEFARVMFGETPKSAYDFKATLVGASYQEIIFSQVLNTTSNNQGAITGIGISSGKGNIGKFHSDDYGYLITMCSVMPDTYYCTGLKREDTYQTSEDFYLPERSQLGMQAVLNKELYNDVTDLEHNDDVFGYQNRFDEMRYRANEVHGKVADLANNSFSPYIQTRHFQSRPNLTPEFVTTKDNVSTNWLTHEDEVPYIIQVANRVSAIRPLPYRATPATFGM